MLLRPSPIYSPFNLSILECKYLIDPKGNRYKTTFNLSILECKWYHPEAAYRFNFLLISPYWNVN